MVLKLPRRKAKPKSSVAGKKTGIPGWVRCQECQHEWKATSLNARCSDCGSRKWIPISAPPKGKEKGMEKHDYLTSFDVETQAKAEFLINAGMGENLEEVAKKLIENEVLKQIKFGGGKQMANIEVTRKQPDEVLEDITTRRALAAETKRIEAEADAEVLKAQAEARKAEMAPEMERIKERASKGEKDALDDMEQLISRMMKMDMISAYIDKIKGVNASKAGGEVDVLKQQLQQLQQQLVDDKRTAEIRTAIERQQRDNEQLRQLMLESVKSKAGDTQGDVITKMGQIFTQRDSELEKLRLAMANLDRESRDKILDVKLGRLEEKITQSGPRNPADQIREVSEVVSAAKAITKEFGVTTEKSKSEMAMDLVTSTIDKIKEPILGPVGQAMAENIRTQRYQQRPVVEESFPEQPRRTENLGVSAKLMTEPKKNVKVEEEIQSSPEVETKDELVQVSIE